MHAQVPPEPVFSPFQTPDEDLMAQPSALAPAAGLNCWQGTIDPSITIVERASPRQMPQEPMLGKQSHTTTDSGNFSHTLWTRRRMSMDRQPSAPAFAAAARPAEAEPHVVPAEHLPRQRSGSNVSLKDQGAPRVSDGFQLPARVARHLHAAMRGSTPARPRQQRDVQSPSLAGSPSQGQQNWYTQADPPQGSLAPHVAAEPNWEHPVFAPSEIVHHQAQSRHRGRTITSGSPRTDPLEGHQSSTPIYTRQGQIGGAMPHSGSSASLAGTPSCRSTGNLTHISSHRSQRTLQDYPSHPSTSSLPRMPSHRSQRSSQDDPSLPSTRSLPRISSHRSQRSRTSRPSYNPTPTSSTSQPAEPAVPPASCAVDLANSQARPHADPHAGLAQGTIEPRMSSSEQPMQPEGQTRRQQPSQPQMQEESNSGSAPMQPGRASRLSGSPGGLLAKRPSQGQVSSSGTRSGSRKRSSEEMEEAEEGPEEGAMASAEEAAMVSKGLAMQVRSGRPVAGCCHGDAQCLRYSNCGISRADHDHPCHHHHHHQTQH